MFRILAVCMAIIMLVTGVSFAKSVTLTWDAPADDKGLPTEKAVTSYKLVYSDVPITEANFLTRTVIVTGVPKAIGGKETYTIDLPDNKHYYFNVKSYDAAGNESPLSNSPELDFFFPSQVTNLNGTSP